VRAFVYLAEDLHFGQAARRLYVSQSALSQQIQRLERELCTQLFHRAHRKVWLTAAGREFLRSAQVALELAERAATRARAVGGRAGDLAVSYVPGFGLSDAAEGFIYQLCGALAGLPFDAAIRPVAHSVPEHLRALSDGSAYLGFSAGPEPVSVPQCRTVVLPPGPAHPAVTAPVRMAWPIWASQAEISRVLAVAAGVLAIEKFDKQM
jgi:DNA-binding transcriptional LysR family regulator